ncbi:hypothetical protein CYLTODRAFT_410066 [Cylindrobasidium torrendii FP15055 ss-10]|uniref:Uncharacterized protein n=1 Tax=Cylindrobasidium torrendii FP15055 ss-10 TaxID=1314674 RepID=A0A0D7BE43_9AGAR|nr:hypothetical protein CYLTODRAFT_410066 [Cylindrobasidium torrendii FP15055 ss-10]
MADAKNEGHATIPGATVYYLHKAPEDAVELKAELKVLHAFLVKWNSNTGDDPSFSPRSTRTEPQLPVDTKAPPPATRLVVTSKTHKSTHASSADQAKHLSVYVCTDDSWALDPHEYGAVVHVFPVNENPANGYQGYFMFSKKRQKLNSLAIKESLEKAEANNFGRLDEDGEFHPSE